MCLFQPHNNVVPALLIWTTLVNVKVEKLLMPCALKQVSSEAEFGDQSLSRAAMPANCFLFTDSQDAR